MLTVLIESLFQATSESLSVPRFNLNAFLAILLVSLICGLVSPLVIGSRMAFFSDALAHTALAGIAIGVLVLILLTDPGPLLEDSPYFWAVPVVMVVFGGLVGLAIAYFRELTGQSADTIIGVFFALAAGFGVMLIPALNTRARFDPEKMLFGFPYSTQPEDFLFLSLVLVLTLVFLGWQFNALVFGGFNPTLAKSRGVRVRLSNYLFILLLAMVVNFSIKAVGVLLINALLVVPAAAAANLARNLRQMFWYSLAGSLASGMIGYALSWGTALKVGGHAYQLRPGGTIVVVVVGWFFFSIIWARLRGRAALAGATCEC
jgi:zinc transport system permease protein